MLYFLPQTNTCTKKGNFMPYIAFMTVTKGCSEKLYAQNNSVELYKADRRTSDISFDEFFLLPQKNNLSATCPIWVRHLRSGEYSCKAAIDLSFLQSLSYKLCHLFYHSKSVVRHPAPVVVKTLLNVFIACSFSLPLSLYSMPTDWPFLSPVFWNLTLPLK